MTQRKPENDARSTLVEYRLSQVQRNIEKSRTPIMELWRHDYDATNRHQEYADTDTDVAEMCELAHDVITHLMRMDTAMDNMDYAVERLLEDINAPAGVWDSNPNNAFHDAYEMFTRELAAARDAIDTFVDEGHPTTDSEFPAMNYQCVDAEDVLTDAEKTLAAAVDMLDSAHNLHRTID